MSELFTPPRIFRNVIFHRHTDRSVSWLELFYDLVYIATLIQIGNFLSDNLSLVGFAQFLVMFGVVWWAWTGETLYQNRYVVDDLWHRLLVFIQMFAIATMGLSVSAAFGDLYVQFTLAYVMTRAVLVIMYLRAMRAHPESDDLSWGYVVGFTIGLIVWLASLLLPPDLHWVGWLLGITVELAVPLTPYMRPLQREWGVDVHHLTERFGIFTIIVLGEAFVKVLDDAQGSTVGVDQFLFSIGGLLVLSSLWWLYFTDTADKLIDFASSWKPVAWIYSHMPLSAGLVAFAVGAKKLYSETIAHPGDPVNPDYRLLYTVALVLYLVALALIDLGLDDDFTHQVQRREALVHVLAAGVIGVVGVAVTGVDAIAFVALVAVVMAAQVIYSIYVTRDEVQANAHLDAHPAAAD